MILHTYPRKYCPNRGKAPWPQGLRWLSSYTLGYYLNELDSSEGRWATWCNLCGASVEQPPGEHSFAQALGYNLNRSKSIRHP